MFDVGKVGDDAVLDRVDIRPSEEAKISITIEKGVRRLAARRAQNEQLSSEEDAATEFGDVESTGIGSSLQDLLCSITLSGRLTAARRWMRVVRQRKRRASFW